ncbi:hypothetical protein GIS00_10015 [Nakamurella sp. YIM 132087]|uniref:Uncharacterized protein n=1 Tax=Nakamurella alba TaxID=2665158 RepID=A0A7K1FJG9_9ACTN|nr:DUF6350 family protein [Nakamurella alba]MTD14282.1 hypothetical protein [Nakamurella alba]
MTVQAARSRTDAPEHAAAPHRPAAAGRPTSAALVAAAAAVRALIALACGLLITGGLALLIWAITPASGSGPLPLLRGAVAAYAGGHGMDIAIDASTLTIAPLALGVLGAGMLWATASGTWRGRAAITSAADEIFAIVVAAAVYGIGVGLVGTVLAPPGALTGHQWWMPACWALVVLTTVTVVRGDGLRAALSDRAPWWLPLGVRLGGVAIAGLVGAGAIVLAAGLLAGFGDATTIAQTTTSGLGDGAGMALAGLAFLPNAVIDGLAYATGTGFGIGAGHYTPLAVDQAALPGLSIFAAAPSGAGGPRLLAVLVPVVVALVVGRSAVRRCAHRADRLLVVGVGAVVAGIGTAVLGVLAGGGVTGGAWATSGPEPLLLGVSVVLEIGVVGGLVAGSWRAEPRETVRAADRESAVGTAAPSDDQDVADDGHATISLVHPSRSTTGSVAGAADTVGPGAAGPRPVVPPQRTPHADTPVSSGPTPDADSTD